MDIVKSVNQKVGENLGDVVGEGWSGKLECHQKMVTSASGSSKIAGESIGQFSDRHFFYDAFKQFVPPFLGRVESLQSKMVIHLRS